MTLSETQLRARLAHDVGKHVARTAINLGEVKVSLPEAHLRLLVKDLFEIDGTRSALQVFQDLLNERETSGTRDNTENEAETCLLKIEALSSQIRAGEVSAVEQARVLALRVRELLEITRK